MNIVNQTPVLTERFRGMGVASALVNRATTDPDRAFIRYGPDLLTVGQVDSRSEALAAALAGLGIESGDRVAIVLPAWPEFVVSLFAMAKLGAVAVPLDPRLTRSELQYMLRHSRAVAAIAAEEFQGTDFLQLFEEILVQLPEMHYLVTVGEEDLWYDDRIFQWEDLLSAGGGRDYPAPSADPSDDPFAIVYTSGTTGKPKGVELTHANILHAAAGTAEILELSSDDSIVGVTALFHVFGLGPGILGALTSGATLILQDTHSAADTLDLVEEWGVTVHYGVPTVFVTEIQELERQPRDLSSLRVGVAAGAPVGNDLVERVERDLCPRLHVAYSLAETASTICMTRPDDPVEVRRFTVGRPIEGSEIRILDPQEWKELPVESVGEIAVRGPGVMKGYYRQPRETANCFDDEGFFLTGDLGMVDDQGFVHLVGRRKDVIIRAGSNVYPRELEDRLNSHPAVHDAVVVGVPDDVLGEAISACIVPVEGAVVTSEEIQDWCAMTLADYKVPDMVRFLDEFPLTGTGKVRRVELSRMLREEQAARRG
ncbi:MAG: class I adenylate-forming enzyme family protein [Gemmatimonadota bacterium]